MSAALHDVAVIGGGMVGVASAWHCRERGLSVALIDPGDPRVAASYGNAGVISRGSILPVGGPAVWRKLATYALNRDPGLRIDYAALPRLAPWLTAFLKACTEAQVRRTAAALNPLCAAAFDEHVRVAEQVGARHLITRRGWLKLYRTEEAYAGAAFERTLIAEHGVRTETFDGHELKQLEPALTRPFAKGVLFTDTGAVSDPGGLVAAWTAGLLARGVTIHAAAAQAIDHGDQGVTIRTPAGVVAAKQVVIAAGAASPELTRPFGIDPPFAAERGYHRHFAPAGDHPLTRPVHDVGGHYVLAPMAAGLRVTSGVELTDRWAPANHRQIEQAEAEARGTASLGRAIDAPWLGSRPSTPDGIPIIGRPKAWPNLILAFGHGHIGLSTGPITGKLVAEIATRATSSLDTAPYAVERF